MYNRVVVPLDGSDLAGCSLEEVKKVIGAGSHVFLLQVVQPFAVNTTAEVPESVVREAERKNVAAARKYLDDVQAKLKGTGAEIHTDVVWGNPADEIIQYAKKNKADLITITTHGRSGISRWAYGSVADRVLRSAALPILMITPSGCRLPS